MSADFWESVQGPSRFLGLEVNAAHKSWDQAGARAALLFADVYDLGMSHLGYKIIYHALNAAAEVVCERAFCPDPALEALMRAQGQRLKSLESRRPLNQFDVLGVSLAHELAATNLLTLLDLAGVTLLAAERGEEEPLIVAGGPAAFNPEPLAPLLDAVFLGDGEEGAVEMVRLIGRARRRGLPRAEILARLSALDSVYVPAFFEPHYQAGRLVGLKNLGPGPDLISRRIIPDLNRAFLPQAPIIPFGRPVHDRLTLELARGCSRGCRFCQAGVIYRPVRERAPQAVYDLALKSLKKTGYDEISLLSLSAGDYHGLTPLLRALMARLEAERVAVSLPSLRADTLTQDAAELIRRVRMTGFTLAPEAGSARLRAAINKDLSEEEIIEAALRAARSGWRLLKLYFMFGLPTETDEDLEAIGRLVATVTQKAPSLRLHASLSLFVPKPHTPFQWEGQLNEAEARRRLDLVKKGLKRIKGVRPKWNSVRVAQLEGLLSRGDRLLGPVILKAWRAGARFDAWTDHFNWAFWEEALAQEGLSVEDYLSARDEASPLPWDHLQVADKGFLLAERAKAYALEATPDCRQAGCQGCGVCDLEALKPLIFPRQALRPAAPPPLKARLARVLFAFHKLGPARLLGHLEMVQVFYRAFRRAGVRVGYSEGFHPQPRFSFFDALAVGAESLDEWAEVELIDPRASDQILKAINAQLPEGLKITLVTPRSKKLRSKAALYRVSFDPAIPLDEAKAAAFLAAPEIPFERRRPGKIQRFDLRPAVEELQVVHPGEVEVRLAATAEGPIPRADEVVRLVFSLAGERMRVLKLRTFLEER